MASMAVKLTNDNLEQIEQYLAEKYPALKGMQSRYTTRDIEIEIRERIVRVEEELKNQRDLLREILSSMDKRFEQVDKKFSMMMWFMGGGFTIATTIITWFISHMR